MAKGQMRPQNEVTKAKKDKSAKAAPASFEKRLSATRECGMRKG